MRPLLLCLLGALLLGACRVDDLQSELYACAADADCGEGWRCVERVCRLAGAVVDAGVETACTTRCGLEHKLCCGRACVDPASDRAHCGACDHPCGKDESCLAGRCVRETKAGACGNGLDDDGDGLVDCQDTADCTPGTACRTGRCCQGGCRAEDTDTLCSDGRDNDCDGKIDCAAPGCAGRLCASGSVCDGEVCRPGCSIQGRWVQTGERRPDVPCLRCDPEANPLGWSPVARGTQVAGCDGQRACDGAGACRRTLAQPCAGPGDCASHRCQEALCRN